MNKRASVNHAPSVRYKKSRKVVLHPQDSFEYRGGGTLAVSGVHLRIS